MRITVTNKKGKVLFTYNQFQKTSKVGKFRIQASKDLKKSIFRLRFTFIKPGEDPKEKKNKIALTDDDKTFAQYNLPDGNLTLIYKDLGPQISWRTIFLVEYFGPLLAHAIPYFFSDLIFDKPCKYHQSQNIAFCLIFLHYMKREFETLFVHRFSNSTMPVMNIFKNSFYYWCLGGFFISYFLYHPLYTPPAYVVNNPVVLYGIAGVMVFCEIMNFDAHVRLRNLRPLGTKKRGIPFGQIFTYVSCANYFWEICIWFCFALLTNCATSYLFFVVGAVQMVAWGKNKHANYKREFGKRYPKNRKAVIPFIL